MKQWLGLVLVMLLLGACRGKQFSSALEWVPANIYKVEVTNWNVLKQQYEIKTKEDFYQLEKWTDGTYGSGLVWNFDLKMHDNYLTYFGFTYPQVEYEAFVNVEAYEPLYIVRYADAASVYPMKNYLDSGNYELNNYRGFTMAEFKGTKEELRKKFETGVSFYGTYAHIAFNEQERIIIFTHNSVIAKMAIDAGREDKNLAHDKQFDELTRNENSYYTYVISKKPFQQTPVFGSGGRIQDYDGRLSDYMGISIEELKNLKTYTAYWMAISNMKGRVHWDVDLIYSAESVRMTDESVRNKILKEGRSFLSHAPYSELFESVKVAGENEHFRINIIGNPGDGDLFYRMIFRGDLGFMLVY